jgi:hypothetical protein
MNEPRRRGRPTVTEGDTSTSVNVRIPSRDYDRAYQIAQRQGTSVSAVLRRGIRHAVCQDDDDDE